MVDGKELENKRGISFPWNFSRSPRKPILPPSDTVFFPNMAPMWFTIPMVVSGALYNDPAQTHLQKPQPNFGFYYTSSPGYRSRKTSSKQIQNSESSGTLSYLICAKSAQSLANLWPKKVGFIWNSVWVCASSYIYIV